MFRFVCLVMPLILVPAFRILAQGSTVRNGDLVRVELRSQVGQPIIGTVVDQNHQMLLVRVDTAQMPISKTSVRHLDVSQGRGSRTINSVQYGAAGLLVGAAGGALIGPLLNSSDCRGSARNAGSFGGCVNDLVDGRARLEAVMTYGIAGGAIGALIGALLNTDERWREVSVEQLRVSIVPRRDGVTAGITVVF